MATASISHNSCAVVAGPQLPVVSFPTVEQITQSEIESLLSLCNRARLLAEQIAEAEESIQARLEANASVEPGEHTAELKEGTRRSVAWRVVAERLAERLYGDGRGEGYCERVLLSTHPTRTVSLIVR